MAKDYYKEGTWNAVCAVCGWQYKADQLRERWDGVKVCNDDWEPRNILDFFKVMPESGQSTPWSQSDSEYEVPITTIATSGTTTLTASLTEVITRINWTAFLAPHIVALPAANDPAFLGSSLIYTIIVESTSIGFSITGDGGLAVAAVAGGIYTFMNYPSRRQWVRLS